MEKRKRLEKGESRNGETKITEKERERGGEEEKEGHATEAEKG